VLHDDVNCIGCRRCQRVCPYSTPDVVKLRAQFSVISYHPKEPIPFSYLGDVDEAIPDGTSSEYGVREAVKMGELAPAYRNQYTFNTNGTDIDLGSNDIDINDLRRAGIVDKCYFCVHRVFDTSLGSTANSGERRPYCVIACPAQARELVTSVPTSPTPVRVLAPKLRTRLQRVILVDKSTITRCKPNVFYCGNFNNR